MTTLSVTDLYNGIKFLLEESFPFLMIKGEISKQKVSANGHLFFELKDQNASINCVCWKDKISKLSTYPKQNIEVIVKGYITIFKSGTRLNLTVIDIEEYGKAMLIAKLEQTKIKLEQAGYFDNKYKQALPEFPQCIGVITSENGAVIEDIKNQIQKRFPTKLLIYSITVQGKTLVNEAISGIEYFNRLKSSPPNVIIIARGGGSFDDLYHFNDESIVKAVFKSKIPIVSAIGHETDSTLLDFVADIKAITPTEAGVIVTPHTTDSLMSSIDNYKQNLYLFCKHQLISSANKVKLINQTLYKNIYNLSIKIYSMINVYDQISLLLAQKLAILNNKIQPYKNNLHHFFKESLYKYTTNLKQETYKLKTPYSWLEKKEQELKIYDEKLQEAMTTFIKTKSKDSLSLSSILKGYSVHNTLKRGFVLVQQNEKFINRSKNLSLDKSFDLTFYDGKVKTKS